MSLIRDAGKAVRATLVLWLIVGIVYPLAIVVFAQIVPFPANGSLLENPQGKVIGSALIGQPFTSDRYFWSRPSTVSYSTDKAVAATGVSGASNLAPSNPDLIKRIQGDVDKLKTADIQPTADLVYTSGSGLDPHISIEAAKSQMARVASSRQLDDEGLVVLESLIDRNTDGRFLGIFGEPGVNVLKLNLALDRLGK
ncbi:MAG: K(+)-transporting ATPase subunit C [Cyanosarcina radialis HA8281-LM2]|jgi:K+-transporting ATPase ATPase C chain|nr:K(+)-transporting ATPase subunit C [Cyanosarcina radialis HA8281-LM2]